LYNGININSTTTGDFKLYNNSFITNSASLNTDVDYHTSQNLKRSLQTDRFKETGRIEKGSDSKQEFESVDMDFNVYPSNYSTWRILPLSEKPFTAKEVNVLYCGNCGIRRKKDTHKFCPNCGTKF
jgi:rubrerythrin